MSKVRTLIGLSILAVMAWGMTQHTLVTIAVCAVLVGGRQLVRRYNIPTSAIVALGAVAVAACAWYILVIVPQHAIGYTLVQ
jgi:hypothetical protein